MNLLGTEDENEKVAPLPPSRLSTTELLAESIAMLNASLASLPRHEDSAPTLSSVRSSVSDAPRGGKWFQVSGHKGDFKTGHPGTIYKKASETEKMALEMLMTDSLKSFVPFYFRELEYESVAYLELQDLLQHFDNPSVMDIKMGTRTFQESEVGKPVRRMDLLEKMIAVDPAEPSEEEKQLGITKQRYMQFRERESSTASLGFRVEGIKIAKQEAPLDFKKLRTREQVLSALQTFLPDPTSPVYDVVHKALLDRLRLLCQTLTYSQFFQDHEFIGTSILFIYDHTGRAGLWMIDFAKTLQVSTPLTHSQPWVLGNHEDGYLIGLENLIAAFEDCTRLIWL